MKHNNEGSVTIERMRILYDTVLRQNVVTFLATFIIAYIYREQFSHTVILIWASYMFSGVGLRFLCLSYYKKNSVKEQDHSRFENFYVFANGFVAIGWAIYIVASLNLPSFTYRIYSILLLAALVGAAVPVLMSSYRSLLAFIVPPLAAAIPLLFILGEQDSATGVAVFIYSLVILRAGKYTYQTLVNSISERIYNQNLVTELERTRHEKSESEKRMQSIMDYSPAAIYVRDIDGKYTFLNQKVVDIRGMPREKIIGKTLHELLPADIAQTIYQNDRQVIEAAKPMEYEESIPMSDGIHHFISTKFPLFDETGKVYAVGGVSTDISERFRIEESLRISQERLLLHREQSPLGIIEWNTDFEITGWNPAAQNIFGFTQEQVLGQHISKTILPESGVQAANEVWEKLLTSKGSAHSINENITRDGKKILCEWHNSPLIDDGGKVIGVTSVVDDITERVKNEESLRHTLKMDAIGKLTGGIAHDFNNMLSVILGFSEQIKEGVPENDPEILKYNDEIANAAERARKLTSKLLEFSRKAPSSDETVYMNRLIYDMQHLLERTLTPRIKLFLELDDELWPVYLDGARLEDSVLNICINAMHAMPEGGNLILATYNMQLTESDIQNMEIEAGDYVLLSISDNGTGMTREVLEQIFDPFFTTKGLEGTGLGLSQVYGFVQQAGGSIKVYSEQGHGTRIAMYFPRHKIETGTNVKSSAKKAVDVKLAKGKENILLVDDEPVLLELTSRILTKQGYSVELAENAEQALDLLKEQPFDLMLSDVIMPGMDGYELAAEVEKRYPNIKIQMVSGFSGDRGNISTNTALYENQIQKPFSAEKLLNRIRELLDETSE